MAMIIMKKTILCFHLALSSMCDFQGTPPRSDNVGDNVTCTVTNSMSHPDNFTLSPTKKIWLDV